MKRFSAFTLIELIVVMGILAILATIVIIAVNPARQFASSRNSKRASDTRAIAQAVNQHAADNNGQYHVSITSTPQLIGTSQLDLTSVLVPNYLSAIPFDPQGGTSANTLYRVYLNAYGRITVVAPESELSTYIVADPPTPTAAQFVVANTEWFSINDNASLSTGDISFTWAGWINLDTLGISQVIIRKNNGGAAGEYLLTVHNQNRLSFNIYNGVTQANVLTGNNPSQLFKLSTWHFVVAWHDAVTDTINVQIDNQTPVSSAVAFSPVDSSAPVQIGASASGATSLSGELDELAFWKRALTTEERLALYNNGKGRTYYSLSTAEKSNLVSWWTFNEVNGNRSDFHGSNTLTDNNTVMSGEGLY